MTKVKVHIFIGEFKDRAEATAYTQATWEPEPGESASDQEYEEWEENNPKWIMREDLNCYLDSDFIETITSDIKLDYFSGIVKNAQLTDQYANLLSSNGAALILIFDKALHEREAVVMKSTNRMKYIGEFETVI